MLFSTRSLRIDDIIRPQCEAGPETPETPQSFDSSSPAIRPVISGFDFFRTELGILKLTEVILGILTTFFIAGYCQPSTIYNISLVIISICILSIVFLIFIYIHSIKLFFTIRQSPFETFFNAILSIIYLIFPTILLIEAMNAGVIVVTLLGAILFIIHAYDAYKSHIWYKQVLK
ncbi:uncharacterized protein [Onthophagus taurus]|uniref:uncharacterized protein n=1 Tax=Onthophagus taurus TaxID=166361 RepID=UPI000C20966D|nr:proteolipid protein 2-like [Onthophagus taurus]